MTLIVLSTFCSTGGVTTESRRVYNLNYSISLQLSVVGRRPYLLLFTEYPSCGYDVYLYFVLMSLNL